MEQFDVSHSASGFGIEGFPDAERVVRLDGVLARSLAYMALHRADLEFADECLVAMNDQKSRVVRGALWRTAIVSYTKCFKKSSSRENLEPSAMFAADPVAAEEHLFVVAMRDKHVVHDDNLLSQSAPCAVINRVDADCKVEKIVCFAAISDFFGQEASSNLRRLISTALQWVEKSFDDRAVELTKQLEALPRETLLAMPSAEYRKPTNEDVSKSRGKNA